MEKPNGEARALPSERKEGTWPAGDDECTAAIIRRKARQIVLRTELPISDQEDIEQDLSMYLWRKVSVFDPNKGPWLAFVTTLVSHEATKLLRMHRAQKRGNGSVTSLPSGATANDQSAEPLCHETTQDGVDARTGHVRVNDQSHIELSIDIKTITESLSPEWQLMLSIRSIKPMSEVSRDMTVPRSTLNARMTQIRRRFESAGLNRYFQK